MPLTVSNILISDVLDGRKACYPAFDHAASVLYLVDDTGTSITGVALDANGNGSGQLSNSQCTVDGARTSLSTLGFTSSSADLTIGLTFSASFQGNKVIYGAARTKLGLNTG